MKKNLLFMFFLCITATIQSQNQESIKFIEVIGSSEMEIEPDEIRFIIRIKEYWEEEFEKKAKPENFRTKVTIKEIENELLNTLMKIGVKKENIVVQSVGDYWRERGKDFLVSKQLELKLYDFKIIDKIINRVNMRGIDYMNIGELKNKNITSYRRQGKMDALKAAKEKAKYLLAGIGKEVGDVISVIEPEESRAYYGQAQYMSTSNVSNFPTSDGIENVRKIKLRYEMKAKFEIK